MLTNVGNQTVVDSHQRPLGFFMQWKSMASINCGYQYFSTEERNSYRCV